MPRCFTARWTESLFTRDFAEIKLQQIRIAEGFLKFRTCNSETVPAQPYVPLWYGNRSLVLYYTAEQSTSRRHTSCHSQVHKSTDALSLLFRTESKGKREEEEEEARESWSGWTWMLRRRQRRPPRQIAVSDTYTQRREPCYRNDLKPISLRPSHQSALYYYDVHFVPERERKFAVADFHVLETSRVTHTYTNGR